MSPSGRASLCLAILTLPWLVGCAGTPRDPAKSERTLVAPASQVAVSPTSFRGDPVGYAAAVIGRPGTEPREGRFEWKIDKSRYQEIRRAMTAWCTANGGTLPPGALLFEACTDASGEALTRLAIGTTIDNTVVIVETPALARRLETERQDRTQAHRRYVASNGASGSLTLVDGRRFEVLRIGSAERPIDYHLQSGPNDALRMLREVRRLQRTAPAGERTPGSFDVTFADGSTVRGVYALSSGHAVLKADGSLGHASTMFGGIPSSHLLLVVRDGPTSRPSLVRIVHRDIAELRITGIDDQPAARIPVQVANDAVATALQARWARAAAGKPSVPYRGRPSLDGPDWCRLIQHGTIESSLVCRQLEAEHEIAARTGVQTSQSTPAMLAGESLQSLAARSLM